MSAKCQRWHTSRWHRTGNFLKCLTNVYYIFAHLNILINELTSSSLSVHFWQWFIANSDRFSFRTLIVPITWSSVFLRWRCDSNEIEKKKIRLMKFGLLEKRIENSPECMLFKFSRLNLIFRFNYVLWFHLIREITLVQSMCFCFCYFSVKFHAVK